MTHNNRPKVSIVLPTYNGERWLAEAIQSVIAQTLKSWELIIVNDCSTDKTKEIAESFAKQDSRISVISNEQNKKLPASLNVGFTCARGDFLTWTSDDNLFKTTALEKMSSYLDEHPDTDMVSMNEDIIDEDGNVVKDFDKDFRFKRNAAYLIHGCNVGAAFMYRRTIADKAGIYDESMFCAEDYDYWCRIALNGRIDYTNDNVYQYRDQAASLSRTKRKVVKDRTNAIRRKYATSFFTKYSFTEFDQAKLWAHHP